MNNRIISTQRRVLFSATLVRGHIAKFHLPYLRWFKQQGWETWVAAKNDYPDGKCEIPWCDHFVNIDFARSPFSPQTMVAYKQLRDLFNAEHFDLVHTHTPVGSVLTRLAARNARKSGTRVIYTAHGFHFYKGAPLLNWLLWYPVERYMSSYTDTLVTINCEDYQRARKFAHCDVEYVPGVGIDLERFSSIADRQQRRSELGLSKDDFAVLSIGDLNKNKNHGVLIESLSKLPNNIKLFIAGNGELKDKLIEMAERLEVSDRVTFLGFRTDIPQLLQSCDLFCMPSFREGLPVSLMEAEAAGTACLASTARGCADVLGDLSSDCIVNNNDSDSWSAAIAGMLDKDKRLKIEGQLLKRADYFSIDNILKMYQSIYLKR